MSLEKQDFTLPKNTWDGIVSALDPVANEKIITDLNALKKNDKWSDWKKWYMDFWKSFLMWAIIVLVTLCFLNKKDDERNNARYSVQKQTDLRINAINSFKKTSLKYLYTASDIFKGIDTSTSTYSNFKGVIYDEMSNDIKDLNRYFRGKDTLIQLALFKENIQNEFKNLIQPIIEKRMSVKEALGKIPEYESFSKKSQQLREMTAAEALNIIFPTDKSN